MGETTWKEQMNFKRHIREGATHLSAQSMTSGATNLKLATGIS